MHTSTGSYHGLLGTVVDVTVTAGTTAEAARAEESAVAEIRRLERVFSVFDHSSELARWSQGETEPGPELGEVLALALEWMERSGGAFNVSVGSLVDVWNAAAEVGMPPSPETLQIAAGAIQSPPYTFTDGAIIRTGRVEGVDLNALAKGWIVDRAVARARTYRAVETATVNAGGDLVHAGSGELIVGIEDPFRPYDNVAPLLSVRLANAALATSGRARRGWRIGDRWYGHVLDPRTGATVDRIASASVVAADAATADVVATILTVLEPGDGVAFVEELRGVSCCLITMDEDLVRTQDWTALEVS